jgi:hypothetical protein
MANTITLKGIFGVKESFNVATPGATAFYAGQLFKVTAIPSTSAADMYVALQTTSGAAVLGVALDNAADYSTAIAGMQTPSGAKVTILHGHSRFEIVSEAATKCYEQGSTAGNMESASLMDLLYCSANGKFTNLKGGSVAHSDPHAIGFVTKVPTSANNYTLGVVLFG